MKRLTKTYSDGTHGASDSLPCGENSYDYKNLLIEKLGKYEDLEEQDRLVILSCKYVYYIVDINNPNCQRNSNSRDNEPCCRCDSRKTNADRIRNMSDEELASVLFSGCIDSMDLEECPYASESELDNNKIRKICKKCTLDWLQSETE